MKVLATPGKLPEGLPEHPKVCCVRSHHHMSAECLQWPEAMLSTRTILSVSLQFYKVQTDNGETESERV